MHLLFYQETTFPYFILVHANVMSNDSFWTVNSMYLNELTVSVGNYRIECIVNNASNFNFCYNLNFDASFLHTIKITNMIVIVLLCTYLLG